MSVLTLLLCGASTNLQNCFKDSCCIWGHIAPTVVKCLCSIFKVLGSIPGSGRDGVELGGCQMWSCGHSTVSEVMTGAVAPCMVPTQDSIAQQPTVNQGRARGPPSLLHRCQLVDSGKEAVTVVSCVTTKESTRSQQIVSNRQSHR